VPYVFSGTDGCGSRTSRQGAVAEKNDLAVTFCLGTLDK
jgi:hypothetical protein